MARKLSPPRSRAAGAADAEPAPDDSLDALVPERALALRDGRRITVREYGHVEWLRLLPQARPLVDAIAAMLEQQRAPTYEEALGAIAQHIDSLLPLVAQACDVDAELIERLPPDEGELLLMTWWGCNGRFFVARAVNRVAVARQEQQAPSA